MNSSRGLDLRSVIAELVQQVVDAGAPLDTRFQQAQHSIPETRRSWARDLAYGTVRWFWRLEDYANQLLSKPVKRADRSILFLIIVALYEIEYHSTPPYAVVSETVNAIKRSTTPWAAGLVNAVLREFLRQQSRLRSAPTSAAAASAHPDWLRDMIFSVYPDHAPLIIETGNSRPPMILRVDAGRIDREDYLHQLQQAGYVAHASPRSQWGVVLPQWARLTDLPGFETGLVSVQDDGAQLTPIALELKPGLRILDACAAPGGKAGHILETEPQTELVALDVDPARVRRIHENMERLGRHATITTGDARNNDNWWDGRKFDRILLDAPCSGTGVIRRHPDIKHHRRATDIDQFTRLQRQLLAATWELLNPGGIMVYVTCSLIPEENERQIRSFMDDHSDAQENDLGQRFGKRRAAGRQLLPGIHDTDGFYYASLSRH